MFISAYALAVLITVNTPVRRVITNDLGLTRLRTFFLILHF